jgi:hypothetical protein
MSILARLIIACCLVVVVGLAQSAVTIWSMNRLAGEIAQEAERPVVVVDSARAAWERFQAVRAYVAEFTAGTSYRPSAAAMKEFVALTSQVEAQLTRLASYGGNDANALLATVSTAAAEWKVAALVLMGDKPATSIPAPHIMAQIEEQVGSGLQQLVEQAHADASETGPSVSQQ